jgi:signal transduction histidine kinase
MTFNRWWHLAALAAATLGVVVLLLAGPPPALLTAGLAVIGVMLVTWMLVAGRKTVTRGAALALVIVMILVAGVGTAITPAFATIQFFAYPLMWTLCNRLRNAIIANVAVALAVGVGFVFSRGSDPGELLEIALTVALSLGFSLAFGLWISHYANESSARQHLLEKLTATQDRLAAVSREAGVVAERERLARDIHDTIAQDLTGMVMLAQRARQEADATPRQALLQQLEDTAREALTDTRALVADSAPAALDAGLVAALERLASRFEQETNIPVVLEADGTGLDRPAEVVVLRCTQEALSNVRKHSAADTARVALASGTLTISDTGRGFDPTAPTNGFGLSGMRDRLALVGGSLDVVSGASGTTLTITLPVAS